MGSKIHQYMNFPSTLEWRVLSSTMGCSIIFLGLGIFVAIDMGLDPFTSMAMIVRDKTNFQFKTAKVICDITSATLGFVLGGKAGIVTVVVALMGGPSIQFVSELFKNAVLVHMKLNNDDILQ